MRHFNFSHATLFSFLFLPFLFSSQLRAQCTGEVTLNTYYFESRPDGPDYPGGPILDSFFIDVTFTPKVATDTFFLRDGISGRQDTIVMGKPYRFGASSSTYMPTLDNLFTYEFGPFKNGSYLNVQLITPGGCVVDVFSGSYNANSRRSSACPDDLANGFFVPFYDLDFSGRPNGVFKINNTKRYPQCCKPGDRCLEFLIKLDENSQGIKVDISGGGGYVYYASVDSFSCATFPSNTNSLPKIQTDICLSPGKTYYLLVCKAGANENEVIISGIAKPSADSIATIPGAPTVFSVSGFDPLIPLTWTNIQGDPSLQFLSCTNCSSPIFNYVASGNVTYPLEIIYQVSGVSQGNTCVGESPFSLEVKAVIYDSVKVSAVALCDAGKVTLVGNATGGSGKNFTYRWYNDQNLLVYTGQNFSLGTPDGKAYTVVVTDEGLNSAAGTFSATVQAICCEADAGQIDNNNPVKDQLSVCAGGDLPLVFSASYAAGGVKPGNGYAYQFLLFDKNGNLVQFNANGDFNFSNLALAGSPYALCGISYRGDSLALANYLTGDGNLGTSGDNKTKAAIETDDADGKLCMALSCAPVQGGSVSIAIVPDPSIRISGGKTICVGGSATLEAQVQDGTGNCTIQWQSSPNGQSWANIAGANGTTLQVSPTATTQYRASYTCTGAGCNAEPSAPQTVSVVADPTISISGGSSICAGSSVTLNATVNGGAGTCTIQWQFSTNGQDWTNINGANNASLQVTPAVTTLYRATYTCDGTGCNSNPSAPQTVTVAQLPIVSVSGGKTICVGGSASLTATITGLKDGCVIQWQSSADGQSWTAVPNSNTLTLQVTPAATTQYRATYLCSGAGCSSQPSAPQTVVVVPDPSISISGGATICVGGNVTLSATLAGGTGNCAIQWQSSPDGQTWITILNANGNTLQVSPSVTTRYRATYTCNGTGCNAQPSSPQVVTVVPDPVISISGGGTICSGGTATLNATVNGGAGNCDIQWQSSPDGQTWTNIPNASSSILQVSPSSTTQYRATYTCSGNGCNAQPSAPRTVTVVPDPGISISGGGSVCSGNSLTLAATVSGGAGNCTIQWQSSPNGQTWTNIANANGATLVVTPSVTTQYRASYSCTGLGCNSAPSNVQTVTVIPSPAVTLSGGTTICVGGSVNLNASAENMGQNCAFLWQSSSNGGQSWNAVANASGANLTVTPGFTTLYRVTVICPQGGCSSNPSAPQTVRVVADPVVTLYGGGEICSGGSAKLRATISGGTGTCAISWQSSTDGQNWITIPNVSSELLTVSPSVTTQYRALYACTGGGCNANPSEVVTIKVVPDPTISISGGRTICAGETVSLAAVANGGISGPGDCFTGQVLTSKSPFTIQTVANEGVDPTELDNSACTKGTCKPIERQSMWFRWTCQTAGTLSFKITPLNSTDDYDFVVYELPNGISDCAGKNAIRCMSSGENVGLPQSTWIACTGATGLRDGETDNIEYCGCATEDNNFVAPVNMVAGKSYALLINNYSGTGIGFSIEWGGTGTFANSPAGGSPFGCNIQWQSSTNNGQTWADMPNAIGPALQVKPSVTTQYRARYTCSESSLGCSGEPSNPQTVTVLPKATVTLSGGTTICVGGTVTLNAQISGGAPDCGLQWQSSTNNGQTWTTISGATNASVQVTPSVTTQYRAILNCPNSACVADPPAPQTVTVVADPTVSVSDGATVCVGASHTLTATVNNGTGSCGVQWQFFNTNTSQWENLAGQTGLSLVLNNLQVTTQYRAIYNCTGAGCGPATSEARTVTVVPDPSISVSGATTVCSGGNASLTATVNNGTGTCSVQWQSFNPTTSQWENLNGQTGALLNLSNLTKTTQYRATYSCTGTGCGPAVSDAVTISVVSAPSVSISGGATVCIGGSITLNATTGNGVGTCGILWQILNTATNQWENLSGQTSTVLILSNLTQTNQYRAIYSCTGTSCGSATSNTQTVTVVPDPSISTSGGATICAGGSTTLNASVNGGIGNCVIQWQSSTDNGQTWTNIANANATAYIASPTVTTQYRATYTCSGDGCNANPSNVQTVTVLPVPIASISGGSSVCLGGSTTLNVNIINGKEGCSIQWQVRTEGNTTWTDAPNGNSTSLTISPSVNSQYRVLYNCSGNNCNSAPSNPWMVMVMPAPTISISGGTTICVGGSATLTATPVGSGGTCTVQWQSSADNGQTWNNILNANSTVLQVNPLATTQYRAIYSCTTSGCQAAPSNVQTVTVLPVPIVAINGASAVCIGGSTTLNATVMNGKDGCAIQWQFRTEGNLNWTDVPNGSGASLLVSPTVNTQYRAILLCTGNGCNSAPSNPWMVMVVPLPVISTSGGATICVGGKAILKATASGGAGTCAILWQSSTDNGQSWTNIPNSNTATLEVKPAVTTLYRALYTCTGGGCNSLPSNAQKVEIGQGYAGKNDTREIYTCNVVDYDLSANVLSASGILTSNFSWVAQPNSFVTGESTTPKQGAKVADVLTNTSDVAQIVVYTVSALDGGACEGKTFTITVTVLPRPKAECLACNSQLNVQLDKTCSALITLDMALRGDFLNCPNGRLLREALEVIVDDGNGNNVVEKCGSFRYVVRLKPGYENCFNWTPCWGTVLAEDTSGPEIAGIKGACGRNVPLTGPWEDTFLCTDVDAFYFNSRSWSDPTYAFYSGAPVFVDGCKDGCNCGATFKVTDQVTFYDCSTIRQDRRWAKLTRVFTGEDCRGNKTQVTQTIYFVSPEVDPDYYRKRGIREITISDTGCAAPTTAEMVAEFKRRYYIFDHPYTCGANKPKYAYFPEAISAGNATYLMDCNFAFDVEILGEFPVCSGGKKVEIAVKGFDWCAGRSVPMDTFVLRFSDGKPPVIALPERPVVISTGPASCAAAFGIDLQGLDRFFGIKITDNCTSTPTISLKIWSYGPLVIQGIPVGPEEWRQVEYPISRIRAGDGREYLMATNVPPGKHRFVITAFDACLNQVTSEFEFTVQDLIAPVMSCNDLLTVSLSNGTGGYARVMVADVNKGSNDNCGMKWIRIRRTYNPACAERFIDAGYDQNDDNKIDEQDGKDWNKDGDIDDYGEKFAKDAITGKLMTPLLDLAEFFCCDVNDSVQVQLWGEDLYGNRSYCWQWVKLEDQLPPTWIVPDPVSVPCSNTDLVAILTSDTRFVKGSPEYNAIVSALGGDLQITSGAECRQLDITMNLDAHLKCDAGYVDITWTIQKPTSKGTLIRTTEPVRLTVTPLHEYDILFPADISNAACGAIPETKPVMDELGCDILAVYTEDKVYQSETQEIACYKIFRTFTVINWCQYNEDCGDPLQWAVIVPRDPGNDGFDGVNVLVRDRSPRDGIEEIYFEDDNDRIPETAERVSAFTYRGGKGTCPSSGNDPQFAWTFTQVIMVQDDEKPVVVKPAFKPFSLDPDQCMGKVSISFTANDDCGSIFDLETNPGPQGFIEVERVRVQVDSSRSGLGIVELSALDPGAKVIRNTKNQWTVTGTFPEGEHKLIVTVRDACGNVSDPAHIPMSIRDLTAPQPICIESLSLSLMEVDTNQDGRPDKGANVVWANDLVASPVYDCNGQGPANAAGLKEVTRYSINRASELPNIAKTNLIVNCDDAGKYIPVELHAWDKAGNHGFCLAYLYVADNTGICTPKVGFISGRVKTERNDMVEGVEVQLSGGANQTVITQLDGEFKFSGIDPGYDYTIYPFLDKNHNNGVSTFDLVLIQRHILGISLLNSPYKLIAADINNSRTVTTFDLILLRKVILNIDLSFPNNKSWRFVDAKFKFPDPQNPWKTAFPEVLNYNDLPDTVRNADMVGVKIGDPSGNVIANSLMIRSRNAVGNFWLTTAEQELVAGNTYKVTLSGKQWNTILGCQFTLEYNRSALELADVEYGLGKEEHFGVFPDEGIITASWNPGAEGLPGREDLVTLVFKARSSGFLSDYVNVSSRYTLAEAYTREGQELDLDLAFDTGLSHAQQIALFQNVPNPFSGETLIRFTLPEAQQAVLTIHDVKGRMVYRLDQRFDQGQQEVRIDSRVLPSTGVFYYTLTANGFTATRKMLRLE